MNNKKRILIFITIILFTLSITASVIGILNLPDNEEEKKEKEETPKITEEYNEIEINKLLSSEGTIYYNDKTKDIIELTNTKKYIIGNNGTLFKNKIEDNSNSQINNEDYIKIKNYKFIKENDNYYYIDTKTNKKSKNYYYIYFTYKNKAYGVNVILETKNNKTEKSTYEILNTNTSSITKLNIENIKINNNHAYQYVHDNNQNTINLDYFNIYNDINKQGIIDINGNIIIDLIYDEFKFINDSYIIAKKDNKYGLIDKNNKEIIPFEYDRIFNINTYLILEKDKKLSIANKDGKIFIKDKIDISSYLDTSNEYYFTSKEYNNKLYLSIINNNKNNIYLINSKDIERKISTNNIFYNLENNYIYDINETNNKAIITYYDNDLYEYYSIEIEVNSNIKHTIQMNQTSSNNIYEIKIIYDINEYNKTYYVDMFNSKKISEKDALTKYFSNGYNFYITENNILKIYKNKELLEEFENIETYLGNYLFLGKNEIFEIKFKKNSSSN